MKSFIRLLTVAFLFTVTNSMATIQQKIASNGITETLHSGIIPVCGDPNPNDIHCTLVVYEADIPAISINKQIDAGTGWAGGNCQNTQPVYQEFLPWGMEKNWFVAGILGKSYPFAKGTKCAVIQYEIGGEIVKDQFQLLTDSKGNYVGSVPYTRTLLVN